MSASRPTPDTALDTPDTPARPELSRSVAGDLVFGAVGEVEPDLVALRRDLHRHPELSWRENRTTGLIRDRLEALGYQVRLLRRSGLLADLGDPAAGETVALRADLDALPIDDRTQDPWASKVPGVAHACGHDVHTAALLGAAIALARVHREGRLVGRVRLIFQPAEEVMPGGALSVLEEGGLDQVAEIFALHCDPGLDVGEVGLRVGPLTGAADALRVELSGAGGHTSRPHLTQDLTFALAKLATELPAALSRRFDPRAGVSVVWGVVQAGSALNVIPSTGRLAGTVRMLDAVAWQQAEELVSALVRQIVAPYRVAAEVHYTRGVPPVVNDPEATAALAEAVRGVLGEAGVVGTQQSMGGEDFGWYLDRIPGAMGRLGTRSPGGPTYDLHQGDLRIDERAVGIGARVLAGAALEALGRS